MRRLLLPLLLLLALAAPAAASAESNVLFGDGQRYAAWDKGANVRVYDDRGRILSVPAQGELTAVSAGRLVFTTYEGQARYAIVTVDLATGRTWRSPVWQV